MNLLMIFFTAAISKNVVLNQTLGICPFLGVSKKTNSAVSMGLAVIFVLVLSSVVCWVLNAFVLVPLNLTYLRTIVFILVIASLVQLVDIVLKKFSPALYNALGIYLALITTNCAVLGTANMVTSGTYNMGILETVVYSLAIGVGFLFALFLMSGIREKMETSNIPRFFRGFPITLIAAGIMSMAFYGLGGVGLTDYPTKDPVKYYSIDALLAKGGGTEFFFTYIMPVIVVAVLALLFAFALSYLGTRLKVDRDERIDLIKENLSGANCGGCGYAGCDAFAEALLKGEADLSKCNPTSADGKAKIAEILGITVSEKEPEVAVVYCNGGNDCGIKSGYQGYGDCESAVLLAGGNKACEVGCLGLGSCSAACQYDAITVDKDKGVAVVDPDKCIDCKACVRACPKKIIGTMPKKAAVYVACANKCPGKVAREQCKNSCIACGICQKTCRFDAIHVVDNVAVIDYSKCTGCGECVAKCPRKCILVKNK